MYVEIFDEYVEKELRYGSTSYSDWITMLNDSSSKESWRVPKGEDQVLDIAATMATLRE